MHNEIDPDIALVGADIDILEEGDTVQNMVNAMVKKMLDTYFGEPLNQETLAGMANFLRHYMPKEFLALTGKELQIPVNVQAKPGYNGIIVLCQIKNEKYCSQIDW